MSGEPFQCGYGAIVQEDVDVLEACMYELVLGKTHHLFQGQLRVIEIGMHDGGTAKGIEAYCQSITNTHHNVYLEYYGIDPDDGTTRPRHIPKNGKVICGQSSEVFDQVPPEVDLVWVDGCHCRNCVILDIVNYAPKVKVGGFLCFHDANPVGQGQEHQYHGPEIPEFGLQIHAAIAALRFPWDVWEQFMFKYPTDRHNCGTLAYRRIGP